MHPRAIGGYLLGAELGRGGMGIVWEASHPELPGRRLALKQLPAELAGPEGVARFVAEARSLARVSHPGVARIHAAGREGAFAWLVTDLVAGPSLGQVLAEGRMEPVRAALIVADLADALEAVHAAGIVHRDVKPENVILLADDRPVLLDFGLARELDRQSLTRTGEVLGTPAYVAPEQILDPKGVDARADVYGLGALLHALLSGRAPFRGGLLHVLEAALAGAAPWPATEHRALDAVCRRAMAREPAARFGSARALGEALRAAAAGERRGVPRSLLAAACVGVLGVAVAWSARQSLEPEPPPPAPLAPAPVASSQPAPPPDPRTIELVRGLASRDPSLALSTWRQAREVLARKADERLRTRMVERLATPLASARVGGGGWTVVEWVDERRLLLFDGTLLTRWTPGKDPQTLRPDAPLLSPRPALCVIPASRGREAVGFYGSGHASFEVKLDGDWPPAPLKLQQEAVVHVLRASPDGDLVAALGGPRGTAPLPGLCSRESPMPLPLEPSPDGRATGLVWVGPDLLVVVFARSARPDDLRTYDREGKPLGSWSWSDRNDATATLGACAPVGDGRRLIAEQGSVSLQRLGKGAPAETLAVESFTGQYLPERIEAVAVAGRWVFVGGRQLELNDGRVCLFELRGDQLEFECEWSFAGQVVSLTPSADAALVAVGTDAGHVAVLGVPASKAD